MHLNCTRAARRLMGRVAAVFSAPRSEKDQGDMCVHCLKSYFIFIGLPQSRSPYPRATPSIAFLIKDSDEDVNIFMCIYLHNSYTDAYKCKLVSKACYLPVPFLRTSGGNLMFPIAGEFPGKEA